MARPASTAGQRRVLFMQAMKQWLLKHPVLSAYHVALWHIDSHEGSDPQEDRHEANSPTGRQPVHLLLAHCCNCR
jgi:hypothetical protein